MNSKILIGVAGLVGLYYMTDGQKNEADLRAYIDTKDNELRAFTQKYLATKQTRVVWILPYDHWFLSLLS